MGCCSVTQRHSGVDEVGPDEIELLELSGDNVGVWSLGETRLQLSLRNSRDEQTLAAAPPLPAAPPLAARTLPAPPPLPRCPSKRNLELEVTKSQEVLLWGRSRDELHRRIYSNQPIREWEGKPAHLYGEIVHSSLVSLYSRYTQESSEHFLVLFSFHLLILSLDHTRQDFIYQGILPLSGLFLEAASLEDDHDSAHSPHMFEISSPVVDSKLFVCSSAADLQTWLRHIEERKYKSTAQPMSPTHCALSYLLPCNELWKREELGKFLLQAPIWQWEGSPIQHMGQPRYMSVVHINTHTQGPQERLLVLFPQDVLLLSVDSRRLNIRYEGRLPRHSIRAVERSALCGRLEFDLIGEMVEPLQVSCSCPEDYRNWMFELQQPDRSVSVSPIHAAPPIMPKLRRSRKESQEVMIRAELVNGYS